MTTMMMMCTFFAPQGTHGNKQQESNDQIREIE